MADLDEELDSIFDDSSLGDDDMNDFLNMMDDESLDMFSDDDESSFISADLGADDDIESFGMTDDWGALSDDSHDDNAKVAGSNNSGAGQESSESSFIDIDNLFVGIDEDVQPDEVQAVPKPSLWQKIKAIFKKKELTEEQKQELEAEEAEEAEYEQRLQAQKAEKKKIKSEAKVVAKAEADRKKQDKKQVKAAKTAAKKAEANKKKQEKAAKKAKAAGGPIPKSQLVPTGPLFVFVIIGIALSVVVIFGSDTRYYSAAVKSAKELFVHQKYASAYHNLIGLDIKEKDKEFYEQVEIINRVDDRLSSYNSYMEINRYEEALNSLLVGVRAYNDNIQRAGELGVDVEFKAIYNEIIVKLSETFGVGIEQANSMLGMTLTEYDKAVTKIASDAMVRDGLAEETVETEDN